MNSYFYDFWRWCLYLQYNTGIGSFRTLKVISSLELIESKNVAISKSDISFELLRLLFDGWLPTSKLQLERGTEDDECTKECSAFPPEKFIHGQTHRHLFILRNFLIDWKWVHTLVHRYGHDLFCWKIIPTKKCGWQLFLDNEIADLNRHCPYNKHLRYTRLAGWSIVFLN